MNKLKEAQEISAEDYAKLTDLEKKAGDFTSKVVTFTYQPAVTTEPALLSYPQYSKIRKIALLLYAR